ncbi:MAG: hypothetical protein JO091_07070 [Acidobacteriaceae bacterium]|nr:hypothetical protein [Acidobacteriaceae bacterium]
MALVCAAAVGVPPIQARTRQGDKLLKLGQKAERDKKFDLALSYYDQALETDRDEPAYIMADQRMRVAASQADIAEGRRLQQQQKLDEALLQFQKAFVADPSSQVALEEIRQTTAMIKQRAEGAGTPILTPVERARQQMEERVRALQGPPELRSLNTPITSLKINNQPARVLFESIGKLAGINVLFDPGGIDTTGNRNFNLDLSNVTLEEALNYVALETHAFWKPISRNAIFVTQETDPKRQEYQDEVVKVFYVQNASTTNEFNEIFNGVRTGAKLTVGVFSVPSQNAIIARGPLDTIALVEKLVHDLDRPKPEVMIDVIVMSVNRTTALTLGAFKSGLNALPVNFAPRPGITTPGGSTSGSGSGSGSGSSTTTSIPIANLSRISSADFSTTLPSTVVNALMSDNNSHILQRPQLRATDGGKASLKIGLKVPYVSGSLNSAVATPGAIPYATTQFQQIDVGTNIDLEPHVNGPDEISMHVKVEISNIVQQISIAGINEPEIGQQVDDATIRMKDGEVSLLGGLSDKEYTKNLAGLPGLTNIPLLGYLFGEKDRTRVDSEILIALIPHILRPPDLTAMGEPGVYAGSERITKVERRAQVTPASLTTPPATNPPTVPVRPPTPLTPAPNPKPPVTSEVNPPATTVAPFASPAPAVGPQATPAPTQPQVAPTNSPPAPSGTAPVKPPGPQDF